VRINTTHRMSADGERARRIEEVALALTLTVTFIALHGSRLLQMAWQRYLGMSVIFSYNFVVALVILGFALLLALPARRRSGLTLGHRPPSWGWQAALVVLPVVGAVLVYPLLPERPYALASPSMWLISPVAQEIWFLGFIYGRLDAVFSAYVHPSIRLRQALVLTAIFFSLSHLQGVFSTLSAGFITFQLLYTFVGCVVLGLTRQWTGSILYATVTHTAVNYVAWSTP
jgi:membrane protease YdiL (CAAX protease family)